MVTTGSIATFAVGADGNRLHYTWLRDGQPIVGSPDRPQYSLTATYKDANHAFSVLVVNDAGQITSAGATLTLALTPDEKLFEAELLNGGYYSLSWNLSAGATQTSGTNYLFGEQTTMPYSPLVPGSVTEAVSFANLAPSLPFNTASVTPVLLSDSYLLEANYAPATVSYDGNGIETYDTDTTGKYQGRGYTRTNYTFVALSGPISATPAELALSYNVIFSNPNILDQTVNWQAGAGYLKYTEVAANDQFVFVDCYGSSPLSGEGDGADTDGCGVVPGSDITATMTKGIYDPVHNVTHVLADGTVVALNGASVWIATAPDVPAHPGATTTYLAYAQATTGVVSQGKVIKAGTVIAGDDLETLGPGDYAYPQAHFRLNPAAFASLQAASKL